MICAIFHCAGKYPLSRKALNNWLRYFIPIIGSCLRMLPVLRSQPDDCLCFMLLMTSYLMSFSSFETFDWWFELIRGL
jgi:hypothetical protein